MVAAIATLAPSPRILLGGQDGLDGTGLLGGHLLVDVCADQMLQPPLAVVAAVDGVGVVVQVDAPADPAAHRLAVGGAGPAQVGGIGAVVPHGGDLVGGVVVHPLDDEEANVWVEVDSSRSSSSIGGGGGGRRRRM